MLPGVGVFGTSLTARVIIPLLKNEGFAVKALWGRTQEEAEELAKEMNVPFYTNRIDDVLLHQDVDLVCINLPPPLTRQIAVKTLGEYRGRSRSSSSGCQGWMLRAWRDGRRAEQPLIIQAAAFCSCILHVGDVAPVTSRRLRASVFVDLTLVSIW